MADIAEQLRAERESSGLVVLAVEDHDTASRRVLAKLGFRETGQVTPGAHAESLQTT